MKQYDNMTRYSTDPRVKFVIRYRDDLLVLVHYVFSQRPDWGGNNLPHALLLSSEVSLIERDDGMLVQVAWRDREVMFN